jgi:hypothetical protein
MRPAANDWRKDYLVCEHVAQDEKLGTFHNRFRVCCLACHDSTLDAEGVPQVLYSESIETWNDNGLAVYRLKARI